MVHKDLLVMTEQLEHLDLLVKQVLLGQLEHRVLRVTWV
jgi:hypothetical protein